MKDIKEMIEDFTSGMTASRKLYHMSLGELIEALEGAEPDLVVLTSETNESPGEPRSYRGYYSDLAFGITSEVITVGEFHKVTLECLDKTFQGYKGGDFTMAKDTPLWISNYGSSSGIAVMGHLITDSHFYLMTKQID